MSITNIPISNCGIKVSSIASSTLFDTCISSTIYYTPSTIITLGHSSGDYTCTAQQLADKLKLLDLVLAQHYPELMI